jgi:transcriptional regulator with XRE-family HTH domain
VKALQREQRRLGARVRALRIERGWTQEMAAETIAISVKQLRRLEQGQANVTLATLVALGAGFRVDVAELFDEAPS